MLVALSLLAISLSILIYKHPPSTWRLSHSHTESASIDGKPAQSQDGSAEPRRAATEPSEAPPAQDDSATEESLQPTPSPQTTPKATPSDSNVATIPTFTLATHESSDEEEDDLPPPSFPALNSAQRTSAPLRAAPMAPPARPASMAPPPRPTPSLMPPPRINASNLRALPTPSQSMHVPTTGPLPNRGPVPDRGPPVSNGGLAPTVKNSNSRGKVLLSPGHSPLDWANLQRSGKNMSGVSSLIRVTPDMLKHNNGRKRKPAWSSYQGKVYNITPYLPFHPGGEGELRRAAGKDGGKLFMEVHPWVNWENMLGECLVGIMVSEEQAPIRSSLEDMD